MHLKKKMHLVWCSIKSLQAPPATLSPKERLDTMLDKYRMSLKINWAHLHQQKRSQLLKRIANHAFSRLDKCRMR